MLINCNEKVFNHQINIDLNQRKPMKNYRYKYGAKIPKDGVKSKQKALEKLKMYKNA